MPFLDFRETFAAKGDKHAGQGKGWAAYAIWRWISAQGLIRSIVVPGPPRFFGILRSDEELVIPYDRISKIGDDVILVDVVLK